MAHYINIFVKLKIWFLWNRDIGQRTKYIWDKKKSKNFVTAIIIKYKSNRWKKILIIKYMYVIRYVSKWNYWMTRCETWNTSNNNNTYICNSYFKHCRGVQ